MNKLDKRWIWIILGVTSILIRYILSFYPQIIEHYYSRGLFIAVRNVFDYTIGLLPFPFVYILFLTLICFIFFKLFKSKKSKLSLIKRSLNLIFSIAAFLSGLIFLFLFLWGFNYGRVPIEEQLSLDIQALDKAELRNELLTSTADLVKAYEVVASYQDEQFDAFTSGIEQKIRKDISNTLFRHGYPVPGRVRARKLYPEGILLRISTAGFYNPLTGECNVDPGLHALQLPHVMAHEFAHGYGIGDEGSCNFLAYLTCVESEHPIMNYAGLLSYWRSVAGQYRRYDPDDYKSIRATLPEGIIIHMQKINAQMDKFPDFFPAVRNATYNAYLKSQGIEEGMKNYSRVILLVNAYKRNLN